MDDDINIAGWTGAEEKQVTLRRAQAHNISKRRRPRSIQKHSTGFYCILLGNNFVCSVWFVLYRRFTLHVGTGQ